MTYIADKVELAIEKVIQEIQGDAVAVLDPPRAGLHNKVIRTIRSCPHIKKIVYISCHLNSAIQNFVE